MLDEIETGRTSTRWSRVRAWATPFNVIAGLIALGLATLAVVPLLRVAMRLFINEHGELDLSPVGDALTLPDFPQMMLNTVGVVLLSGTAALVVGSVLAWLNERTDARMGLLTDMMPVVPFLLPSVAGAVGWVLLLSPRTGLLNAFLRFVLGKVGIHLTEGPFNIFTWYGLTFVYMVYLVPYAFMMVSAGLRNMDPSLEEQSRISGGGLAFTLRKVTLPSVRPSLGASVLLMSWSGFGMVSVPIIIGTTAEIDVLSVRIVRLLSATFPPATGTAIGLSLVVTLMVGSAWLIQTKFLRSGKHVTFGGKGHRVSRIELGAWRWPARGVVTGYLVVTTILPIVGLVLVTLNGFFTPHIDWSGLSFDTYFRTVINDETTRRALRNSIGLGVVGGLIGIVGAAVVSLLVLKSDPRVGRAIDGVIKFPAAFANVVIAVGFILMFAGPPFNLAGTLTILLMAYLALYMPQGSVAADVAASQVGTELPEASAVCGAGGGRTFRKIQLPLMVPGLIAGWALLFVQMVGDLTASVLLSGTSNTVVSFRIVSVYENGSYAGLAALSLTLVIVTSVVIAVALGTTRRRSRWLTAAPKSA